MGLFLAVSAFRDRSTDDVANDIQRQLTDMGIGVETEVEGEWDERQDLIVFEPRGRWTIVLWPDKSTYFVELSEASSASLKTIASVASIYDGDHWDHVLIDNGVVLDRYSSWPEYFAESKEEAWHLRAELKSRPQVIASALGVAPESIAPYLQAREFVEAHDREKMFPDDEFELENPWVFADFWRRLGIIYWTGEEDWPPPRPGQRRLRLERDFDFSLLRRAGIIKGQ